MSCILMGLRNNIVGEIASKSPIIPSAYRFTRGKIPTEKSKIIREYEFQIRRFCGLRVWYISCFA